MKPRNEVLGKPSSRLIINLRRKACRCFMICVFKYFMVQNQKILFCISPEALGPLGFRYTILSAIQGHPASRPYGHDSRYAQTKCPKDPTWVVPLPVNMSEKQQEKMRLELDAKESSCLSRYIRCVLPVLP